MSILIKGVGMPKSCAACVAREFLGYSEHHRTEYMCAFTGTDIRDEVLNMYKGRGANLKPYNCPLVEVPTPHGGLIDADILTNVIANMMPSLTTPDGTGQYDKEIYAVQEAFVDIMQTINTHPTVIEAEVEE